MLKKIILAALLTVLLGSCDSNETFETHTNTHINWNEQIIYMALTDRFYDGDSSNNLAGGYDGYDPANPYLYHGGDFAGFNEKIDYLDELGVTVLWGSPVYENVPKHAINSGRDDERDDTPATGYHGYVINFRDPDDQAVEPHFGTKNELKSLIANLKRNDMTLIFDMIVNQAGWNADIVTTHPDWFNKLENNEQDNSCAYLPLTDMCIYGLPDFKIDDTLVGPDVRKYLNEMSKGWIKEYDISGIRFDAPMLVTPSYFEEWFREIRSVKPDLFVFAETYDYRRPGNYKPYLDKGFDGTLNFYLQGGLKETFAKGRSTDVIAENMQNTIDDLGLEQTLRMVNFIDNHDVARFMNRTEGPVGIYSEDERRQHLGLVSLMMLPGIPQIYYGNELGAYGSYPNNRRDMPSWAWNKATRPGSHEWHLINADYTFELTKKLIEIRKENFAITYGKYIEIKRQDGFPNPNVYAFLRSHNTSRIIVIMNNEDKPTGEITLNINAEGKFNKWDKKDLLNCTLVDQLGMNVPDTIVVKDGKITINLPAKSAGVYKL